MKLKMFDKTEYKKMFRRQGILRKIVSYSLRLVLVAIVFAIISYLISIPRPVIESFTFENFSFQWKNTIESYSYNENTGEFNIVTGNGSLWKSESNSGEAEADEIARGINRIMMQSQMSIRYVDNDSRIYIATSFVNALSSGDKLLDAKTEGNKVSATYNFVTGREAEGLYISVPVEYEFNDGSLKVSVLTEKIMENDQYKLIEISLLPYFGASYGDEEGYIFIPDGSGALIDFNDSRTYGQEWYEYVYGRDLALKVNVQSGVKETVRLPVFGIKRGESAVLAIVEEGDALSAITVNTQGYNSMKNSAYFSYRFREFDTIVLSEMGWNERRIPFVSKTSNSKQPFTVRYIFLDDDDADYNGMALAHRSYLVQKYGLEQNESKESLPFLIDTYMSIRRVQSVLGLPRDKTVSLTSFDELTRMIEDFKSGGIENIVVKINGWTDGGPFHKTVDSVSFESVIGGRRGFTDMAEKYKDDDSVNFFPSIDLINGYRNGNKFISIFQGNRDITGALSLQNQFLMSTGRRNPRHASWYLITPSYSYGLMNEFLDSYDKITDLGIDGIGLDEYGDKLYSDNYDSILNKVVSRVPMDRQTVLHLWQDIIEKSVLTAGNVMLTGGNQYVIPFADYIIGVPMSSSRLTIASRDVPYYQILTSGLVSIASTPVNFSLDSDEFYLRCLETGTLPLYSFFAQESSLVKNTRLNHLYNGEYKLWMELAIEKYKEFGDVYAKINNAGIIKHSRTDNKSLTRYDNGVVIEIDYNSKSFRVIEGEIN